MTARPSALSARCEHRRRTRRPAYWRLDRLCDWPAADPVPLPACIGRPAFARRLATSVRPQMHVHTCWNSRQHVFMLALSPACERFSLSAPASLTRRRRFAESVQWEMPKPVAGSAHRFEVRLANAVHGASSRSRTDLQSVGYSVSGREADPQVGGAPRRNSMVCRIGLG